MEVAEQVWEQLRGQVQEGRPGLGRPIFVIDGSSLQLPHESELVEAFPPGGNQHGENHWPVMKVVVFHDVFSGLALRPSWGPMYGDGAVSEQALAEEALGRLPANAVVLADGNFGIFAFAHAVAASGRGLVVRLTKERAFRILGAKPLGSLTEIAVVWEPSRWDRQAHPQLPAAAKLSGRIIVFQHPLRPGERVYLFANLEVAAEEVVTIYQLRWSVETDLRSLKRTVAIHRLSGQSVDLIEKELVLAVTAYNLVRAVMCVAARRAGVTPRQLSFSSVYAVVQAILPHLAKADKDSELDYWLERMLSDAARFKIPKRSRVRSFPRQVWGQGGRFPHRKRAVSAKEQSQ
jgi:hypothetical protein